MQDVQVTKRFICVIYVLCFSCFRIWLLPMWSPAGKCLISLLLFVMFNCVLSLSHAFLCQVSYLIVSIPGLCRLYDQNWSYVTIFCHIECKKQRLIFLFLNQNMWKYCLNEDRSLEHPIHMLKWWIRKYLQLYPESFCLSQPVYMVCPSLVIVYHRFK